MTQNELVKLLSSFSATIFGGCTSEDELSKLYRTYAILVHPDTSGLTSNKPFEDLTTLYNVALASVTTAAPIASDYITLAGVGGAYVMERQIAIGDFSAIYSGFFAPIDKSARQPRLFKVALKDCNILLRNEANALRAIHNDPEAKDFLSFMPHLDGALSADLYGDGVKSTVNVYSYNPPLTPETLMPLSDVLKQYPNGINAKDMAWIWRRVLTILRLVHLTKRVHGAVTPQHILIEPEHHFVVLGGWTSATTEGNKLRAIPSDTSMYKGVDANKFTYSYDLSLAAASMLKLIGNDSGVAVLPSIKLYFSRITPNSKRTAAELLAEFDSLIEMEWGERVFRVFPPVKRICDTL